MVEQRGRRVEALGDGRPGAGGLHEAGDEEDGTAIDAFCPARVASRAVEPINRTYAPLQAFVDELVRCGLRHAVTCPGSRNAPLALTLAGRPELEAVSVLDERCAGFFALGMAKATGRPVAVTCTSGYRGRQPAPRRHRGLGGARPADRADRRPPARAARGRRRPVDRPGQALRQRGELVRRGGHPRAGPRDRHPPPRARLPRLLDRRRRPARPGAPQLPAARAAGAEPEPLDAADWAGRPDGRPWTELRQHTSAPHADDVQELAARIAAEPRGAIVCGPTAEDVAEPAARLAAACGWPLLAEPTSGVRCGPHDRSHVVAHYDVLLRAEGFAAAHAPGLVLRVGDMPTSKPLRDLGAEAPQVVLDPHAAWHEPTRRAELLLRSAAAPTLDALAAAVEVRSAAADLGVAERVARGGCDRARGARRDARRLRAQAARRARARAPRRRDRLAQLLDAGARRRGVLPPVAQAAALPRQPRRQRHRRRGLVRGRRGAGRQDAGLAADRRAGAPARRRRPAGRAPAEADLQVVCINNGGGAIFDFLPVAEHADPALYEEHIATPRERTWPRSLPRSGRSAPTDARTWSGTAAWSSAVAARL